jgi:hypothetical protein
MNGERVEAGGILRHFIPPERENRKLNAIIETNKASCKAENSIHAICLE